MANEVNGIKIMQDNIRYVIRYGVLPATDIFNAIGPDHKGNTNWANYDEKGREQKATALMKRRNRIDGFYNKLEASILKDGVRNPVCIAAGNLKKTENITKLPPIMQCNPKKILTLDFQGGSRLFFAQKHNLEVPCLIADFVGRFSHFELLETAEEIFAKCKDKPSDVRMYEWGLYLHQIPHVEMQ